MTSWSCTEDAAALSTLSAIGRAQLTAIAKDSAQLLQARARSVRLPPWPLTEREEFQAQLLSALQAAGSGVVAPLEQLLVELGSRFAARGVLDVPSDVFMLFVDELTEAVAGNTDGLRELVAPRLSYRRWLSSLEPPFIFNGHAPAVTSWPRRGERDVAPLAVGDSIVGVSGCPGRARGRAQVVLDPRDPVDLKPGDVLIAPATDPSWTPLFVAAAAVVVEVGAALSHAVIVSRELGIPCVPSAVDATRRIPTGALVEVDGDAGTVTLLELPT